MPLFLDVATMVCFAFASGMVFVPIMAKKALPAAQRVAALSPSATTTELSAALRPLLNANRIGTLATVSFFLFSMLVSWLD